MGWIGCVRCEKFQCDLMAQTCALIAPVQPILHRVPYSNETLRNAPKHNEMLQNMSLVPMVWIECVLCKKFWCDFVARTFVLIAPVHPVLHRVSCIMKRFQMHPKTIQRTKTWVRRPMGFIGCVHCEKSRRTFVARTFALIATVHPILHRVRCS